MLTTRQVQEGASQERRSFSITSAQTRWLLPVLLVILGLRFSGCQRSMSETEGSSRSESSPAVVSVLPASETTHVTHSQEETSPLATDACTTVTVWLPTGSHPEDSLTRKDPNDAVVLAITPPSPGKHSSCSKWEYKHGAPTSAKQSPVDTKATLLEKRGDTFGDTSPASR